MKADRFPLPLAWLLLALILFNGMVCAVGHGQMLAALVKPPEAAHPHPHAQPAEHAMHAGMAMDMSAMHGEQGSRAADDMSMASALGDCSFAGSLPLALVFFVLLGWLLRNRQPRLIWHLGVPKPLPQRLAQLQPQAP